MGVKRVGRIEEKEIMEEYAKKASELTKKEIRLSKKFLKILSKLDAIQILGCARYLGVRVSAPLPDGVVADSTNIQLRPTEEILEELVIRYQLLSKDGKKQVLKLAKEAR